MAYKARTLLSKPNEPNAYSGLAPARDVAGVTVPSRLKMFSGDPPTEMLDDDCVDVVALTGKAWPRSSCDRNSKSAHSMRLRVEDGSWPTERETELQGYAEAKLADPDGVGRHVLKQQGYRPDEVDKIMARSKATTRGIPSLPDTPKRGPGRPRKTATPDPED